MRTQILFSVFVGIAVSGCGQCEYSCVSQNTADAESPVDWVGHEVPYHLVETMPDSSHVVQYVVESMHEQTLSTMDSNGREEIRSVMVPRIVEQIATIPPGEDISAFLSEHTDGRIINWVRNSQFDNYVESAPAPPAD